MGRNRKSGLDYFPFDVDFFSELKIRKLIKCQGGKAVTVYALLLCNIYKNGYYMRWDKELPFIISEQTGYDEVYIQEVIKSCFTVGLFSKELFDQEKIITSKGIQDRYQSICSLARRVCEIKEFNLISSENNIVSSEEKAITSEEKAINSEETPISSAESAQSKVNKREEKKVTKKEISSEYFSESNNSGQPISKIEEEFERFRKAYPGNKGGHKIEFENFKKKHSDYRTAVYLLNPALDKLKAWREQKRRLSQFVPEYANLSTWLNQRRWEVEFEKVESNATEQTETKRYDNGDFLR